HELVNRCRSILELPTNPLVLAPHDDRLEHGDVLVVEHPHRDWPHVAGEGRCPVRGARRRYPVRRGAGGQDEKRGGGDDGFFHADLPCAISRAEPTRARDGRQSVSHWTFGQNLIYIGRLSS